MNDLISIEDQIKGNKVLGEGARRIVYDLNNGYVVKIAKSSDGIKSNKREVVTYEAAPDPVRDHIAKIKAYEPGYRWVMMKKYDRDFPKSKKQERRLHDLRAAFKENGLVPYETVSWRLKPNYQNLRMKNDGTIVVIDYGNFRFRRSSEDCEIDIMDKLMPLIEEWRRRPLQEVYAVLFVDAIHFKVQEGDKTTDKTAYMVIGIDLDGSGDVLGVWIREKESVRFWKRVLKKLKKRGVEHIHIACVGKSSDLAEAVASRFPETEVFKSKYPKKLRLFMQTKARMIERHRRHFRIVTRKSKKFSKEEELLKILYLHTVDDWMCPVPNWKRLLPQIRGFFP